MLTKDSVVIACAKWLGLGHTSFFSRKVFSKNRFFAKDIACDLVQDVDFWYYDLLVDLFLLFLQVPAQQ